MYKLIGNIFMTKSTDHVVQQVNEILSNGGNELKPETLNDLNLARDLYLSGNIDESVLSAKITTAKAQKG